jgi:hypothetical protein
MDDTAVSVVKLCMLQKRVEHCTYVECNVLSDRGQIGMRTLLTTVVLHWYILNAANQRVWIIKVPRGPLRAAHRSWNLLLCVRLVIVLRALAACCNNLRTGGLINAS